MGRFIMLLFCFFGVAVASGQTMEERVVQQFGDNLRDWCITENINYRRMAQKQCIDACRVKNKIMEDFVAKDGFILNIEDYVIPNYLNGFENALGEGALRINISNVRTIHNDEQMYSSFAGISTAEQEARRSKNYATVACDIVISGVLKYQLRELYYIRKGQIVKIAPYEEVKDQRTGEVKVKVDFSDLVEERTHTLEVFYGYSKNFPLSIGIATNFSYFNIGVEYGQNFSDELLFHKTHMNYATSKLEAGKYWYLLATPGVFLRYASINCGLGAVFATYNYNYESVYSLSSFSEKKNYFMIEPKLALNIPIPFNISSKKEKLYISPHVGYQYVPKYSRFNCWEVGIGVRFRFETY